MQSKISDKVAIEFALSFYEAFLAKALKVDRALTVARKDIRMHSDSEWGVPVLHMHAADVGICINEDAAILKGAEQPHLIAEQQQHAPQTSEQRHLATIASRVRAQWVQDLDDSILSKLPFTFRLVEEESESSNSQQSLIDLFCQSHSLVLLSEPGHSDRDVLLQLTRNLLDRHDQDSTCGVPILLNIASWEGEPLADWVVAELRNQYGIPKKSASDWLAANRFVLIFDELEDLPVERRSQCVEAINDFFPEVGLGGMIVSCCIKEYLQLDVRLRLPNIVRLHPFGKEQIFEFLDTLGDSGKTLKETLLNDRLLQVLARSPAMLDVMLTLTQNQHPSLKRAATGELQSIGELRHQIVEAYVDRRLDAAAEGAPQ